MPGYSLVNNEDEAIAELTTPSTNPNTREPDASKALKERITQEATRMGFGSHNWDTVTAVNKAKELARKVSLGWNGDDPEAINYSFEIAKTLPNVQKSIARKEQIDTQNRGLEDYYRTAARSQELQKKYGVTTTIGTAPKGTGLYKEPKPTDNKAAADLELNDVETPENSYMVEYGLPGKKKYEIVRPDIDPKRLETLKKQAGYRTIQAKEATPSVDSIPFAPPGTPTLPPWAKSVQPEADGSMTVTYVSKDGSMKTKKVTAQQWQQLTGR